jgi:hypothetical protein
MFKARTTVIVAMILLAVGASGCGEDAQGPTPGMSSGLARPASEVAQPTNSTLERIFGDTGPSPASGLRTSSVLDTVGASYSSIPGATNVSDADLTALTSDDPFDRVDEISNDMENDLLDAGSEYTASLDDPLGSTADYDSGPNVAGIDPTLDATMDFDPELDLDPAMGMDDDLALEDF